MSGTMPEHPLVSICMPLYNAAPYLGIAIEGILGQTYQNIELIICDNRSTDDSLEIAERYAAEDSRLKLYQNTVNLGYPGNMQRTASLAQGEFLLFHFADDGAEPDGLSRLMAEVQSRREVNEELVVTSDAYLWNQSGERTGVLTMNADDYTNTYVDLERYGKTTGAVQLGGHQVLSAVLRSLGMYGFIGSTLFSRQLFDSVGQVHSTRSHNPDKQFMYKLLAANPTIVRLLEPLFCLRYHDANQTAHDRSQGVIKQSVDDYAYTYEYSEPFLDKLGLSRQMLASAFIDKCCLRRALAAIRQGTNLLGFRYLAFAMATYPHLAIRNPKTFAVIAALVAGPAGRVAAERVYRAGVWRKSERGDKSLSKMGGTD